MKCPVCGARCEVLETRYRKIDDYWYRRYQCYNDHRFASKEVVVKVITKEDKDEAGTR